MRLRSSEFSLCRHNTSLILLLFNAVMLAFLHQEHDFQELSASFYIKIGNRKNISNI